MYLHENLNKTSINYKLILGFSIYLIYLLISFLTSAFLHNQLVINIIMLITAIILASFLFSTVKTSKLLIDKVQKVRTLGTTIIFTIMFIIFAIFLLQTPTNLMNMFKVTPLQFVSALLVALTAGIFEESLASLLFLDTFAELFKKYRYNLVYASLCSAILFGLFHLSNLSYQSVTITFQQVFYTMVIGLCLSFIRIRSNRLSLCIIIHTLIDFQPTINEVSGSSSVNWSLLLLTYTPFLIIALFAIWSFNYQCHKQLICE